MGDYSGPLKQKIAAPSLLAGASRVAEYERAAMDRHAALFAEFGLEVPDPNDAAHPSWRLLALALAKRHVPAFMPDRGRPSDNDKKGETLRWHMASRAYRLVHGGSVADSDRWAATHFDVDYEAMKPRLIELRRGKDSPFREEGDFDMMIAGQAHELERLQLIANGMTAIKDALADPATEDAMREAIQRIVAANGPEAMAQHLGRMAHDQRPAIRQEAEASARLKVASMLFPHNDPELDAMIGAEVARLASWPYE